jgi:hypothetical protein
MVSSYPAPSAVSANDLAIFFIVDDDPVFAYTAWHLAHSLVTHANVPWSAIHVQCTKEVPFRTVKAFRDLGCITHSLTRFGDGRYCNKLAQWDNLKGVGADHFVFLDTDMICVGDIVGHLPSDRIAGKVVDVPNPKFPLLDTLFERAGFHDRPAVVPVDALQGHTYRANCNGGLYSVPRSMADLLFETWRRRALALLDDIEPLRAVKKESHVDQIAFCMAVHETSLPFSHLASNVNYPLHLAGPHNYREAHRPLALLHYHNSSLNILGLVEPKRNLDAGEIEAVRNANEQIRRNFDTRSFWEFRYKHFPERGSGVGSRGINLEYKRELLRTERVEDASSVLDVGCGDLEVVHVLDFKNYVGMDSSRNSLAAAAERRPDWTFIEAPDRTVAAAETVLCFEVTIHQKTEEAYRELIAFLASKARRTLIVSGYDHVTDKIAANHMLYFYEPLSRSLEKTGKFSSIRKIGSHSDVVIYRCAVDE